MPALRRALPYFFLAGALALAAPACGPLGAGCKKLGCANGRVCNEATDQCETDTSSTGGQGGSSGGSAGGAAGGAAGGSAGGTAGGSAGGAAGGSSGGSAGGGSSGAGGGTVLMPDGGYPNCLTRQQSALICTTDCPPGFRCVSGMCRLNGGASYLQVTLRWDTYEDLDLHVIEPLTDGGTCDVYFGDRNTGGNTSRCHARGSLDLDSEAGCPSVPDRVDIENVIYPLSATLVPGQYRVLVNHYSNCNMSLASVAYQLEVRKGNQLIGLCGVFRPTDPDWGNDVDRTVLTVTVP